MPGNEISANLAHPAGGAVAADEVAGGDLMRPLGAAHLRGHAALVLAQPDQLLSAADLGAELAGDLGQQALELRLGEHQQLHRRVGQAREVHMYAAEWQLRGRDGSGAGRLEPLQQPPVASQLDDPPVQAAGFRDVSERRVPFQHQRPHSSAAQLARQHQPGRTGTHHDHVCVHHHLAPSGVVRSNAEPAILPQGSRLKQAPRCGVLLSGRGEPGRRPEAGSATNQAPGAGARMIRRWNSPT